VMLSQVQLILKDALCVHEALLRLEFPSETISLEVIADGRLIVKVDEGDKACGFLVGLRPLDLDDDAILAGTWRAAATAWNQATHEQIIAVWDDWKARYDLTAMMMVLIAKKMYPRKDAVYVVKHQQGEA